MNNVMHAHTFQFNKVLNYHYKTEGGGLILAYYGEMHQHLIKTFGNNLEHILKQKGASPTAVKRTYHVVIESLQNVVRHGDKTDGSLGKDKSVFLAGVNDRHYIVTTGNAVLRGRVNRATDFLDLLSGMEASEVRSLYKERIRSNTVSERGGAGLGFIDITKKTNNTIRYHIENLNEKAAYLTLIMLINRT